MEWLKCLDKFNKTVRFILTCPILLLDFIWCLTYKHFIMHMDSKWEFPRDVHLLEINYFYWNILNRKTYIYTSWKNLATLFLARHLKPMDSKYQARICRDLGCVSVWQKLFLSTYFIIQLIFATIHGSYCTFWYYL